MRTRRSRIAVPIACLLLPAAVALAQDPGGSGTEDDPWLVDVDALLLEGYAVVETPDTTYAVADAAADTIRIAAPRLRVSEVVRSIAEAMEDAGRDAGPLAFTLVSTVDAWTDRGDPDDEKRERHVEIRRIHVDADGEERATRLFTEKRVWKGGEETEVETDEEREDEWQEDVVEASMAMPFSLLTSNAYRYEIEERTLIGNHLVFRVAFEPKTDFEPGLSGRVWIDYSDFVIRRMEGAMVGPMPYPMFLKGVPEFTFTLQQVDGHWVGDAFLATIELHGILPGIPDELEVGVRTEDIVFGDAVEGGAP